MSLWRGFQGTIAFLLFAMSLLSIGHALRMSRLISPTFPRIGPLLESHMNNVASFAMHYLQHHDQGSLEGVTREGGQTWTLLDRYQAGVRNQHGAPLPQIEENSRALRESIVKLVAIEKRHIESTDQLSTLEKQADDLFAESSGRLSRSRFHRMQKIFTRIQEEHQKVAAAEGIRLQLIADFMKARQRLESRSNEEKPSLPLSISLGSPAPRTNPWPLAAELVLLTGVALLLVFGMDRLIRQRILAPLEELIIATEAAATGDLSRQPDFWSRDAMGRLAKALNRLTTVLARSENLVYHLATLVDSSGDAIISQTLDGTILSWNKGAQRLYGYSAEEVKGRSVTLLTPGQSAIQIIDLIQRIKFGEKIQSFEMIHEGKNGRVVHVFLRVAAIYDSTKKVIGASLCAQDLTSANLLPTRWAKSSAVTTSSDIAA